MASFNKVVLIGRLTNDPEIRTTNNGLKIAQFTVAVDRPFGKNESGEKKTDFFRCKAWRQKADFVEQYIGKARLVCIEGRIELNDYTDKEGQKRYITEIDVANIETLDARDRAGEAAPSGGGGYGGGNRGGGNSSYNDGGSEGSGNGNGNGYFADDEPAPARPAQRPAAAQAAPAQRAPQRAAAPAPAAPARRPAATPAYDEDFDDSDPFADE